MIAAAVTDCHIDIPQAVKKSSHEDKFSVETTSPQLSSADTFPFPLYISTGLASIIHVRKAEGRFEFASMDELKSACISPAGAGQANGRNGKGNQRSQQDVGTKMRRAVDSPIAALNSRNGGNARISIPSTRSSRTNKANIMTQGSSNTTISDVLSGSIVSEPSQPCRIEFVNVDEDDCSTNGGGIDATSSRRQGMGIPTRSWRKALESIYFYTEQFIADHHQHRQEEKQIGCAASAIPLRRVWCIIVAHRETVRKLAGSGVETPYCCIAVFNPVTPAASSLNDCNDTDGLVSAQVGEQKVSADDSQLHQQCKNMSQVEFELICIMDKDGNPVAAGRERRKLVS